MRIIAPLIISIVIVPAAAALLTAAALRLRTRAYTQQENRALPFFARRWDGLRSLQTQEDRAYRTAADLVLPVHRIASQLQSRSVGHLFAAAWLLFIAFTLTAASLTVLSGSDFARFTSATTDAVVFGLVVYNFRQSTAQRRRWIRARTRVEFLRHWAAAETPLLLGGPDADVSAAFEARRADVEVQLTATDGSLQFMAARLMESQLLSFQTALRARGELTPTAVLTYLRRRPLRQARWFGASRERLSMSYERREMWLLILFSTSALLATLRLFDLLTFDRSHHVFSHVTEFLLLVAIGASSCATAIYIGQNGQALFHRYRQQLRGIEAWFETHAPLFDQLERSSEPIRGPRLEAFIAAAAAFERLMFEELLDWIAASREGGMELSPS